MYTISLPPAIRMNAENMIVCALWLGPCKPPMTILLPPVLSKIDKLERDGMKFATQEGDRILKAKLVAGVFDLPATSMALNIMDTMAALTAHKKVFIYINATYIILMNCTGLDNKKLGSASRVNIPPSVWYKRLLSVKTLSSNTSNSSGLYACYDRRNN